MTDQRSQNLDFVAHSESQENDNTFVLYNKDSSQELRLITQGNSFMLEYTDANDNPYTIPQDNIIEIVQHNPKKFKKLDKLNTTLYVFLTGLSRTLYVQYIVLHNVGKFNFFEKLKQVNDVFEVSSNKLAMALNAKDVDEFDDLLESREDDLSESRETMQTIIEEFDEPGGYYRIKMRFR